MSVGVVVLVVLDSGSFHMLQRVRILLNKALPGWICSLEQQHLPLLPQATFWRCRGGSLTTPKLINTAFMVTQNNILWRNR